MKKSQKKIQPSQAKSSIGKNIQSISAQTKDWITDTLKLINIIERVPLKQACIDSVATIRRLNKLFASFDLPQIGTSERHIRQELRLFAADTGVTPIE